jgi:ABC-type lipoprotein export system ATPase subunit
MPTSGSPLYLTDPRLSPIIIPLYLGDLFPQAPIYGCGFEPGLNQMSKWFLESIDINGGFLPGFTLRLPRGLTCIIGPRGSGKSTLMEALRYGVGGSAGATKSRLDLIQANLGSNSLITINTVSDGSGSSYTIKRAHRQAPTLITADGKAITTVDLDRGTFLPLDGYSSTEIEGIADESIGEKRRSLLDELRAEELHEVHLSVANYRRALDGNADGIRGTERLIQHLTEQIEELGDARAKLSAMPRPSETAGSDELSKAARQSITSDREGRSLAAASETLGRYESDLRELVERNRNSLSDILPDESSDNAVILRYGKESLVSSLNTIEGFIFQAVDEIQTASRQLDELRNIHSTARTEQDTVHARLKERNLAASRVIQERTAAEQAVAQLTDLETKRSRARAELNQLLEDRKTIKGAYLLERERISQIREEVASQLQRETGVNVRIRVLRNADDFAYQQLLMEGLRGAHVRYQDEILKSLMRLRPEQLAQTIRDNDLDELEQQMSFGAERSRKILDAFREKIDPLDLEIVTIDDRIRIELNLSTGAEPNFKDASELSRGQKCTALLPLLLARRDTPLVIDQPEDNLDNHFIYETVVETIRRLKGQRQMIFITHNANIPVLAEADLIVVLNSDGRAGYIEKAGSLDECRDEIIDLLEGGREAFELRRQRYAKP